MSTKKSLISEIWSICNSTHGEQDYKELHDFTIEELKEILTDIKYN